MRSSFGDIGSALCVLAVALALIFFVIPAQTIPGDDGELSQAFMPTLAATMAAAASVLMLFQAARTRLAVKSKPAAAKDNPPDSRFWMVFAAATMLFLFSLVAIRYLGFVIAGTLTIAAFGLLFNRRAWKSIAVLSVLFPIVTYVLVRQGLGLALP